MVFTTGELLRAAFHHMDWRTQEKAFQTFNNGMSEEGSLETRVLRPVSHTVELDDNREVRRHQDQVIQMSPQVSKTEPRSTNVNAESGPVPLRK